MHEIENKTNNNQPETFISADEFRNIPDEILEYDGPPDGVNRSNFNSWLIRGFATSRGDIAIHFAYALRTGYLSRFDFSTSINNFFEAGGINSLSEEEKEEFNEKFKSIPGHKVVEESVEYQELGFDSVLLDQLKSLKDKYNDEASSVLINLVHFQDDSIDFPDFSKFLVSNRPQFPSGEDPSPVIAKAHEKYKVSRYEFLSSYLGKMDDGEFKSLINGYFGTKNNNF